MAHWLRRVISRLKAVKANKKTAAITATTSIFTALAFKELNILSLLQELLGNIDFEGLTSIVHNLTNDVLSDPIKTALFPSLIALFATPLVFKAYKKTKANKTLNGVYTLYTPKGTPEISPEDFYTLEMDVVATVPLKNSKSLKKQLEFAVEEIKSVYGAELPIFIKYASTPLGVSHHLGTSKSRNTINIYGDQSYAEVFASKIKHKLDNADPKTSFTITETLKNIGTEKRNGPLPRELKKIEEKEKANKPWNVISKLLNPLILFGVLVFTLFSAQKLLPEEDTFEEEGE